MLQASLDEGRPDKLRAHRRLEAMYDRGLATSAGGGSAARAKGRGVDPLGQHHIVGYQRHVAIRSHTFNVKFFNLKI